MADDVMVPSHLHILKVDLEAGNRTPVVAEGDVIGQRTGFSPHGDHFNPDEDVILRVEAMRQLEHKAVIAVSWIMFLVTFGLAASLITIRGVHQANGRVYDNQYTSINIAGGTLCFASLSVMLSWFASNLVRCKHAKLSWTKRRFQLALLLLTAMLAQWVSATAFLVASVYSHLVYCSFFGMLAIVAAYIRWSAWGVVGLCLLITAHSARAWTDWEGKPIPYTGCFQKCPVLCSILDIPVRLIYGVLRVQTHGEPNMMVLDCGWRLHAVKLLGWAAFECLTLAHLILNLVRRPYTALLPDEPVCQKRGWTCSQTPAINTLRFMLLALVMMFLMRLMHFLRLAMRDVRRRPYNAYRLGNVLARVMRQTTFALPAVSGPLIILIWFFNSNSCLMYVTDWLVLPVQLQVTTAVSLLGIFFMPTDPQTGSRPILQEWLQLFAWTERETGSCLARRESLAPGSAALQHEPMFCFETAIKLLYWSGLAYEYMEEGRTAKRSMTRALNLYGLYEVDVIRDDNQTGKMLLAWGDNVILLAFRGTVNRANVVHDLQAWLVDHPPRRGGWPARPKVHAGFLHAWMGLRSRVMERLRSLLQDNPCGPKVTFLVTGHSLGGALATLAAYDIATELKPANLHVYVYGCPRTGNHAFAREYNALVPNTWQVMTERDIIPRTGKMGCLFKHVGFFAYINERGDLRVRPSYIDIHLFVLKTRKKVAQHLCEAYRQALVAVIRTQFSERAIVQDVSGVLELADSPDTQDVLQEADLAAGRAPRLSLASASLTRVRTFVHLNSTTNRS